MVAPLLILAGALGVAGSLLPWLDLQVTLPLAGGVPVDGVEGQYGRIALALSAATLLLGLLRIVSYGYEDAIRRLATAASVAALGVAVYRSYDVASTFGTVEAINVSAGLGLWAIGAGAVIAVVTRWA